MKERDVIGHVRAMAVLFGLTLLLCCIIYPAILWGFGRVAAPEAAAGSLIEEGGQVKGSLLLAQPFSDPKYFWPRPSAVDYNAAGSGPSNLAASNPKLRYAITRRLAPLARFNSGEPAGPAVQKWFRDESGRLKKWVEDNPTPAKQWCDDNKVSEEQLASFAKQYPIAWPTVEERDGPEGKKENYLKPVTVGEEDIADLQATLFDAWLRANPGVELRRVPADLVLSSGSGLDPHITLRAARYQLDHHVADAWAKASGKPRSDVVRVIEEVLRRHRFRPLAGLGGEELVNVLGVNRDLDRDERLK
jgi:K+-transporting ATPase ATPase C chain